MKVWHINKHSLKITVSELVKDFYPAVPEIYEKELKESRFYTWNGV